MADDTDEGDLRQRSSAGESRQSMSSAGAGSSEGFAVPILSDPSGLMIRNADHSAACAHSEPPIPFAHIHLDQPPHGDAKGAYLSADMHDVAHERQSVDWDPRSGFQSHATLASHQEDEGACPSGSGFLSELEPSPGGHVGPGHHAHQNRSAAQIAWQNLAGILAAAGAVRCELNSVAPGVRASTQFLFCNTDCTMSQPCIHLLLF